MKSHIISLLPLALLTLVGCSTPGVVVGDRGKIDVPQPDGSTVHIQVESNNPQSRIARTVPPRPATFVPPDEALQALDREVAARQQKLSESAADDAARSSRAEADAKARQEQIQELDAQVAQRRSLMKDLENRLPAMRQQVDRLQGEYDARGKHLATIESATNAAEKVLAQLNTQLTDARQQISRQVQQRQQLNDELTKSRAALGSASAEMDRSEQERRVLRGEILAMRTEFARLKEERAGLTEDPGITRAPQPQHTPEKLSGAMARETVVPPLVVPPNAATRPAQDQVSDRQVTGEAGPLLSRRSWITASLLDPWTYVWVVGCVLVAGSITFVVWLAHPKNWEVRIQRPGADGMPAVSETVELSTDEVIDLASSTPRAVARETPTSVRFGVDHFGRARLWADGTTSVAINGRPSNSFPVTVKLGDTLVVGEEGQAATFIVNEIAAFGSDADEASLEAAT